MLPDGARNKLVQEWESLEDPISNIIESLDIDLLKETKMSEIIKVVGEIISEKTSLKAAQ